MKRFVNQSRIGATPSRSVIFKLRTPCRRPPVAHSWKPSSNCVPHGTPPMLCRALLVDMMSDFWAGSTSSLYGSLADSSRHRPVGQGPTTVYTWTPSVQHGNRASPLYGIAQDMCCGASGQVLSRRTPMSTELTKFQALESAWKRARRTQRTSWATRPLRVTSSQTCLNRPCSKSNESNKKESDSHLSWPNFPSARQLSLASNSEDALVERQGHFHLAVQRYKWCRRNFWSGSSLPAVSL